jgi:hypothetical protein
MQVVSKERVRSPRAPKHSIGEAIAFVEKIYEGVHRSAVDSYTVFKLMGFAGKSGSSATALGSMRQYGLIEGVGDRTRVSQLALQILEPSSSSERARAIREAVGRPEVFRAILDRFEGRLPAANEPVRAFLIRELSFSKAGAEESLASLRQSMALVADLNDETPLPAEDRQEEIGTEDRSHPLRTSRLGVAQRDGEELMRYVLTKECSVEIRFQGEISERAISTLIRHIELLKEVWAEN